MSCPRSPSMSVSNIAVHQSVSAFNGREEERVTTRATSTWQIQPAGQGDWSGESHLEVEDEKRERKRKRMDQWIHSSQDTDAHCPLPSVHGSITCFELAPLLRTGSIELSHIKIRCSVTRLDSCVTWAIKYPREKTASGSVHEGIRVNIRSVPVHWTCKIQLSEIAISPFLLFSFHLPFLHPSCIQCSKTTANTAHAFDYDTGHRTKERKKGHTQLQEERKKERNGLIERRTSDLRPHNWTSLEPYPHWTHSASV